MQEQATIRLLYARLLFRFMFALIKFIKIKVQRLQKCLQSIRF